MGTPGRRAAPPPAMPPPPDQFRYDGVAIDPAAATVTCTYSTAEHTFTERFTFGSGGRLGRPSGARRRADPVPPGGRLVLQDDGRHRGRPRRPPHHARRALLPSWLLRPRPRRVRATATASTCGASPWRGPTPRRPDPSTYEPEAGRPLIPFGGGIDSIVTVESLSADHPDAALCVRPPARRPLRRH